MSRFIPAALALLLCLACCPQAGSEPLPVAGGSGFLVAPDGSNLAYAVPALDEVGEEVTRVMVCLPDGTSRRTLGTVPGRWGELCWLGKDRLLLTDPAAGRYVGLAWDGNRLPDLVLPAGCEIIHKRLSPDGRLVAFVGAHRAQGQRQAGLFLVDLAAGEVRCLIEEELNTAPAWSPDSTRLAMGKGRGHTAKYRLQVAEVATGKVIDTGVEGVGAVWSPDGRFLAFTTQVVQGGSWQYGIPRDGRLGLLELATGKVTHLTFPPRHERSKLSGRQEMAGCLSPVWSPDSQWLAYHQAKLFQLSEASPLQVSDQTWIVSRTGQGARKIRDSFLPLAWARDGKAIFTLDQYQVARVDLATAKARAIATWTKPALPRVVALTPVVVKAGAEEMRVEVAVDPRVELVSIIFRLAGNPEYGQGRVDCYTEAVEKRFGRFRQHPAVRLAAKLQRTRGVGYDAPMTLAVHLGDAVSLEPRLPLEPWPPALDRRWTVAEVRQFLPLARQFAKDTGFHRFVQEQQPLYNLAAARMSKLLATEGHLEWCEQFFGGRPGVAFHVLLGMLNGGACYGPRTKVGDREDLYCVLGVWDCDTSGLPCFSAGMLPTVVHEFCHSFVNPMVDAHLEELEAWGKQSFTAVEQAMRRQAYGSWQTMVSESVVRACVVRYLLAHRGPEAAQAEIAQNASRQFHWVKGLSELLADYEAHRDQYPNLGSFFPRLLEHLQQEVKTGSQGS